MARLRIWDERINNWRDCVSTPMFIMGHEGKWIPLLPNQFSIANQHGDRWHEIDDVFDPIFDDPCDVVEAEDCNGSPTSITRGSGDGQGSKGAAYTQLDGYPPGYDLPDAQRSGFGLILNGDAPTGRAISRPGIRRQESYDPSGLGSRAGLGTYANPNFPYNTVQSRGAIITETIYAMPQREGSVELLFASYDEYGMSVDVYHMGQRVASTCGIATGRGRISFQFNPHETDMRIMVRVRAQSGAGWTLTAFPPRVNSSSDRGNLPLDYQTSYDVLRFPDLITAEYQGTPVFPAPCHAAVFPVPSRIVDAPAFEYVHYVGRNAGRMILDYSTWDNFDYFEVYHAGRRIATTLDAQTGRGFLEFQYDPQDTQQYDLMIRVVAHDFGSGASLESQYYSLYCPDTRGARTHRHACESQVIESAGHTTTEDCIELGMQTDRRAVAINVDAGTHPAKFEVFNSSMELLDTEVLGAGQKGTLEFWKEIWEPLKSQISVRVTSEVGSDWRYFVWCPVQIPKLEHRDLLLTHNCVEILGDAEQPPDFDPFPWVCYEYQQLWGRRSGMHVPGLAVLNGSSNGVMWGSTGSYFKFRGYFNRRIVQITVGIRYNGRQGAWGDNTIFRERSKLDQVAFVMGGGTDYRQFTFAVDIEPNKGTDSEVWIRYERGGDQGDGVEMNYFTIEHIKFEGDA